MASAPSGKDTGVQRTSGFCSFQFSRGRVPGVGRPIVVPKPVGMVMSVHKRCVSVGGSRAFRPPRLFTGDRVQARLNPALSASHPVKMEPVLRSPSDLLTRPVALQEVVSSTASMKITPVASVTAPVMAKASIAASGPAVPRLSKKEGERATVTSQLRTAVHQDSMIVSSESVKRRNPATVRLRER